MADLGGSLETLPVSRRVAVAEVVQEMLANERELAALYADFAARNPLPPLSAALAELAQAKLAHVAALEPLARALDSVLTSGPTRGVRSTNAAAADWRGAEFSRAFRGERALEVAYRELAALLGDPGLFPSLPRLAAEAARHRARLRELYLRYS